MTPKSLERRRWQQQKNDLARNAKLAAIRDRIESLQWAITQLSGDESLIAPMRIRIAQSRAELRASLGITSVSLPVIF